MDMITNENYFNIHEKNSFAKLLKNLFAGHRSIEIILLDYQNN